MKQIPSGWKVYFPEDGEAASDAREIHTYDFQRIVDAEDAAEKGCELDFHARDGWERGMDNEFIVIVISPNGEHFPFKAWHEATVSHRVSGVER